MNLGRFIGGIIRAELTSADLSSTLAAIHADGITLRHLQWKDELTCRFEISRNQYADLQKLAEKRGETLRIRGHSGIFWYMAALKRRPVLVTGFLLLFLTIPVLSETVLFLRVEGNDQVPDRLILEAAEKAGIGFGTPRRKIRNEPAKNSILSDIPQLQWVGINTAGCTAVIRVQERSETANQRPQPAVSRIVARLDGYLLSVTATRGSPSVQPGQTVRKGQLLISGYADHGSFIRAGRAEGEILAQTNRQNLAVTPSQTLLRGQQQGQSRRISLILRKKRINLWKGSGISPTTCGRMYEEYYITLPGGFRLPVALAIETLTFRDTVPAPQDEESAKTLLQHHSRQEVQRQMLGGRILHVREEFSEAQDLYVLHSQWICEEELGTEQPEEIGVRNGKND